MLMSVTEKNQGDCGIQSTFQSTVEFNDKNFLRHMEADDKEADTLFSKVIHTYC